MRNIIPLAVVISLIFTLNACSGEQKSVYANFLNDAQRYDTVELPFDLNEYLNFYYANSPEEAREEYPFYAPNPDFETYLKAIGYEGEEYKCFIVPNGEPELLIFLTCVVRGDSEYYLLVTANDEGFVNYLECGVMGTDQPVYFTLYESLEITRRHEVETGIIEIDRFLILPTGDFITEIITDEDSNLFVNQSDWEGVVCNQYSENDGYTTIQKCVFPNANMRQVYDIVKRIDPNLKPELPIDNLEYHIEEDGYVDVIYEYKTLHHLLIGLYYPGGITTIEVIDKGTETQSVITYSAD